VPKSKNKTGLAARFKFIEIGEAKPSLRERMAKRASAETKERAKERERRLAVWRAETDLLLGDRAEALEELFMYGRWLWSKYKGNCVSCRTAYNEGDHVLWMPGVGCACQDCYEKWRTER